MTQTVFIARNRKERDCVEMFKSKPTRTPNGEWEGDYFGFIDNDILHEIGIKSITWNDEPIEMEFNIDKK